ncbi:MAG TPA: hypothetical protein VG366_07265 [Solirubrobacteraceae bacterium]|nr:hypothetical protein [Solirubrobacteraceae bacterium]
MSADASAQAGSGGGAGEPNEEELRAAYEAELGRITATDMMAQAAVSLLNIGARRLGLLGEGEGEPAGAGAAGRDLEQVRDAIDGARALLEILGRRIPQELGPLRDALSRLQMAYAREVQPGAGEPGGAPQAAGQQPAPDGGAEAPSAEREDGAEQPAGGEPRPGPAESSGRLWVPGR